MSRSLRIEYSGAVYHVTSRGNRQDAIFLDDEDRILFLTILGKTIRRYNWICHAYCLMDNHYHLLIETPDGNLSAGMRQLNGVYTQTFNRIHTRVGHVFQGRFKSILVEKESYLLELCRYIVLNPVRAKCCTLPEEWQWSSYNATRSGHSSTDGLTTDWILGHFSDILEDAGKMYCDFVVDGIAQDESPFKGLVGQIVLGGPQFIDKITPYIASKKEIKEVASVQRMIGRPSLETIFPDHIKQDKKQRNRAIKKACIDYAYKLKEIADHLEIHYSTVSRVVSEDETG